MKRVVGEFSGHTPLQNMRPPLTNLKHTTALGILDMSAQTGFAMPSHPRL